MPFKNNKFHIITFGCKINQYESESISYSLILRGMESVDNINEADFVIINTCTVTSKADRKCRNKIYKTKRDNPDCILIVCGCLVNTDYDNIKEFNEIDLLFSNFNKDKIPEIIDGIRKTGDLEHITYNSTIDGSFNYKTGKLTNHARAFLKIQDGCNNFCTYCKIPYARGASRSRNITGIYLEIDELLKNGYEEIVLTGINLGSYLYNELNFSKFLYKLAVDYSDIRFRISSIEPDLIDDDFFKALSLNNVCPHVHIPLQSGSDKILKLMNRHYTLKQYENVLLNIRQVKDGIFLSSDLIIGFPGETDDDFKSAYDFVKKNKFSFIHIFGYSPRKETEAYLFKNKVPERIRDNRIKEIKILVDKLNLDYRQSFINKQLEVIAEKREKGFYSGKSENYIDIFFRSVKVLNIKKRYKVILKKIDSLKNYGELIY